ncbi:DNA cytosine methyltransferase [Roseibacillus persicicus]|uniref:DNA cytosine methyltransferase n=1 Tax=Roseibacillus persicicus TaxID=454148 RepID=UPI0028109A16|nr:DNA cytosine methyltransferase [Roseibacillus persicicus]MDQ8191159.1 DNA cytosine methyltransferase [Roseibacillus persicicus]
MNSTSPRLLDFFAGSGLVSSGMDEICQTVWANDICQQKGDFFQKNHPETQFLLDSISNLKGQDLPEADISWASFPCQDLSLAGNRGGLTSSRSGLFWEWLRLLDESPKRPRVLAIENVIGLVTSQGGEDYRQLQLSLEERGYRVGPMIINAWHWVPQSRPRLFVVAVAKGIDTSAYESTFPNWLHSTPLQRAFSTLPNTIFWNLPEVKAPRPALSDIIEWNAPVLPQEKTERLLSLVPDNHVREIDNLPANKQYVFPGYRRTRNGKQVLELRFDGLAGCLRTAKGGSSRQFLLIWNKGKWESRLITTREAARLMGAPESYSLSENYNESYNAMGDAVAVPVVQFLAKHLLAPLAKLPLNSDVSSRKAPKFCLQP